jgi:predicted metal-dependent phosphoesterase TrpH
MAGANVGTPTGAGGRAFLDLHCHTRASFDSLAAPAAVVRAAARRGLTHLAITDHGRIDGALEARAVAPPGLTVLVGQEVRTTGGDLVGVFLSQPVPGGLTPLEAVAAIRAQGGLVGIPHPFDRWRSSLGQGSRLEELTGVVDWIEAYNARLLGAGNERAAEVARRHRLPGVAVSDAHTTLEVGIAYTVVEGDPSTAEGLRAALPAAQLVCGRASLVVRLVTPVAKGVHWLLGRSAPGAGETRGG